MSRAVRLLDAAATELAEAVAWYEHQRAGLGSDFFQAMVEAQALLANQPEAGPASREHSDLRRLLLARFPYQIVYRTTGVDVIVIAVAHLKRRPGYWKQRAEPPLKA